MSDDITFCGSECNNKKCFRHPTNIAEPRIPHSIAELKGTEYCPLTMTEKEAIEILKEEISGLPEDNPFHQAVSLAIRSLENDIPKCMIKENRR